jgi:hypothetical protein
MPKLSVVKPRERGFHIDHQTAVMRDFFIKLDTSYLPVE